MNRQEVYKLIDGERNYQDQLGPNRTNGVKHTVGDYLTMMGTYYRKAMDDWTLNAGDEQALNQIRKIAGIAVRCMEDWKAPPRVS